MRYRKKPVEVDATPVEMVLAVYREHPEALPEWVQEAILAQKVKVYEEIIVVRTIDGSMRGDPSDWLIRGTRGELYPCKPDAFADTYEKVEE